MKLCLMWMLIKEVIGHLRKTLSSQLPSSLYIQDWSCAESSLPEPAKFTTSMEFVASMPKTCLMYFDRSGPRLVRVLKWQFYGITVEYTVLTSSLISPGVRKFR